MDTPTINYDTIQLERFKYTASQTISKETVEAFATPPIFDSWQDELMVNLVIRIRIHYPRDWWQSFKQRWFPEWALKHWPVIERDEIVDVKALYPTINIPGHKPVINVFHSKGVTLG